jgi:flagellar biosynthesis chaperone FliJ
MAIDFSNLLTDEQKRDLLQQRLQQFAGEAYQHELNRQIAEKVFDADAVTNSEAALQTLETAIAVHRQELEQLG